MKSLVAFDENLGIGYKNSLPWPKIKEDFTWFKEQTLNHTILVGRKTFDSLPPLKNRTILVLNKQKNYIEPNLSVIWLTEKPVNEILGKNVINWLCGGGSIYEQFLPDCDELFVTHVKGIYPADVFFPYSMDEINKIFPKNQFVKELSGGHKIIKYYK